jgi:chorismate mutase
MCPMKMEEGFRHPEMNESILQEIIDRCLQLEQVRDDMVAITIFIR